MTDQLSAISDDQTTLPNLPVWVTSGHAETLEHVAFRSGAALMVLHALVSDPTHGVPVKLLANRLALKAATATSKLEGRLAREADIRDAFHLTQAGEAPGPDGELLAFWREAVRLRLAKRSEQSEQSVLVGLVGSDLESEIEDWLRTASARAETHGPMAGCVSVLRAVLTADSRAERIACVLSDVVLAHALNWRTVLPVSARCLNKAMLRDLVAVEQGAELAVQIRILESVEGTVRLAQDLARKAAALVAVAPKLRAKGSEAAVALFLADDAVAPVTALSPHIRGTSIAMTDRAARRFCDRLVELGVARELTGRPTFRFYGIAS